MRTPTQRLDFFLKCLARYIMLDWIEADGDLDTDDRATTDLVDIHRWRKQISEMETLPTRALLDLLPTNLNELSWIDHRVIDFVTSIEPTYEG